MRLAIAIGCSLAVLSASPRATAAPSEADRRHAQVLFDQGRALLEQGRYAQACASFAESQRLDPGGGTLLNLALCREKEGRLATAEELYSEALSVAIRDARDDRKTLAEERLALLKPRVPRVRIVLPPNVPASQITLELDQAEVPRLAWGAPLPVDPGTHRVRVRAHGFRDRSLSFNAVEARQTVVRFPALERPPPPPPPPRAETRLSTSSWIIGGTGVAALGVSLVTGIVALDADGSADDAIARAGCMPSRDFCRDASELDEAARERDRARTFAWISTGTLIGGGALLATAWLLPRDRVLVEVDRDRVGVSVVASWPDAL